MKKITTLLPFPLPSIFGRALPLLALLLLAFPACSSEDDLTPSYADENYYAPADADNSPTAQLQRAFYNDVHSYLLFSDTLHTASNGETEILDMNFNYIASSTSSYRFTYKYLTDYDARKAATDLLRTKLTSRLGTAVPYSFLLVDSISWWEKDDEGHWVLIEEDSYNGTAPHPSLVMNDRCYAISMNGGEAFDDDEYFTDIFATILKNIIARLSDDDMAPFYAYSSKYYDAYEGDYGLSTDEWDGDPDSVMWQYGFFSDTYGDYFPYQKDDLKKWETAIVDYTLADFEAEFGSSATMMNKFRTLRSILKSKGIKFEDE